MQIEEFQSPGGQKLTTAALRELKRAKELWRDTIIGSKPAVEAIVGADSWSGILERALNSSIVDWLVSLAKSNPPVLEPPAPPARKPQSNSTTGYRGVTRKRHRFQARVGSKPQKSLGCFETAELAAEAIDKYLRDNA